ncbi:FidL-like protein [Citrobacter braakii]|uniref:FidL-like protein n=1 Tax=Citrobacter braakii TaxID=57706 RepID=UPI00351CC212
MKKILISLLIVLVLTGGTLWFAHNMSGTEMDCRATFEKNTAANLVVRGGITLHFFRDHTGVASMSGKIITTEGVYTLNREAVFNYERIDGQKGVYRINKTNFRILSRDTIPARYSNDIDMNTESQSSDYIIIRKINKNTLLFSSPAAPMMICVME